MAITAYSDPGFTTKVAARDNPFSVWINPSSYTRNRSIAYNDRQAQGSAGPSPDFNRVAADDLSFDLMFDATGAIPPPASDSYANGVADVVAQFVKLTGTLVGDTHRPNYLKLEWAQLQYQCVLTRLGIAYTLFRPDGTPLRANLSTSFGAFASESQLEKEAHRQSPDLTHLVTVVAGDTLPLLCHRIYGDSGYYLKVAEANDLLNFRRLEAGRQLVLPPLSGTAR
jgi:hypothetical protein